MDHTFLGSAISEALSDLSEINTGLLEKHLQSLGVETSDDFKFIVEADLMSGLRPIKAQKLLATWELRCEK